MNEILTHIVDPTDQRRLVYNSDPEIEPSLLFLRSLIKQRTIYNININGGAVILGVDSIKRLINLEMGIPQSSWDLSLKLDWPAYSVSGDIEFPNLHMRHYEFEIPTKVFSYRDFSIVHLQIGSQTGDISWISLSNQCMAGVIEGALVGFLIKRS